MMMAFCIQGLGYLLSRFAAFEAQRKVKITNGFFVLLATIRLSPFGMKPFYAFISDVFPIYGFRFKSFMIAGLFIQLVVCLLLFFIEKPGLDTLFLLDFVLNVTSAFISSLVEGVITIVAKIDSKIRYPEFLENSEVFESKTNRFIGAYEFLVLAGDYLFRYLNFYALINKIVSEKIIYLLTGGISFGIGMIIIFNFKERKVSQMINCNNFSIFYYF